MANIISSEEKEILQEIMNISFGKATADLAEIIDIYVVLSVPYIEILPAKKLADFIKNETKDFDCIDIVKQHFWGRFKGVAFLVFSAGSGKELIALFQGDSNPFADLESPSEYMDMLGKETLLEVGNILIGACIGKLTELLGDVVTYSPPQVVIEGKPSNIISGDLFDSNSEVIILKTVFNFDKQCVTGVLFLTASHESIDWLKKAIYAFIGQYE